MNLKICVVGIAVAANIAAIAVFNPAHIPPLRGGLQEATLQTPNIIPVIIKEMNVSAYCPCDKCCGGFADGIIASGGAIKGNKLDIMFPTH